MKTIISHKRKSNHIVVIVQARDENVAPAIKKAIQLVIRRLKKLDCEISFEIYY